jgi:PTH1 family peptidyl-tRNA hydrolase
MKLVFGLGNPGQQYENTLHNAGFLALDELAKQLGFPAFRRHRGAYAAEGRVGTDRVMLVKPQTYMNLSGKCVLDLAAYYKVDSMDILVLYDDVDLPPGTIRVRDHGSAGTHNGMRSIIGEIGTQAFCRIRIGAGSPPPQWDLADYVLSRPGGETGEAFLQGVKKAADAAVCLLEHGLEITQQRYNHKGRLKKEEHSENTHES